MNRRLFDVYDHGNEIGVLSRYKGYKSIPISYRGSIEATYQLAHLTCDVLRAFVNAEHQLPKYLEQFIEDLSMDTPLEEYLTDLRLFLLHGGCDTCGQCRFMREDKTCKNKLPGGTCDPNDDACACGIRKEQK